MSDRISWKAVTQMAQYYERTLRRIFTIPDDVHLHVERGYVDPYISARLYWATKTELGYSERRDLPLGGEQRLPGSARKAYDVIRERDDAISEVVGNLHRALLHGVTDISTDDHAVVIRFDKPTQRDDARTALVHFKERA